MDHSTLAQDWSHIKFLWLHWNSDYINHLWHRPTINLTIYISLFTALNTGKAVPAYGIQAYGLVEV